MHTRFLLLGLLASAHTWATIPQQDTDLIGAWVSQTEAKQDQESYELHALSVYRPDHSYNESVIIKGAKECSLIKTQGTWSYTSPTLSLTLKDSNMPQAIMAGSVSKKTILSSANNSLMIQDEDQRQYALDKIEKNIDLTHYQTAKAWCLKQDMQAQDKTLISPTLDQPYVSQTHHLQLQANPAWLLKDTPQKIMLLSLTGSMTDIITMQAQDAEHFTHQAPQLLASLSKKLGNKRQPSLIKLTPPNTANWQTMSQCYDVQIDPLLPKQTLCLLVTQKMLNQQLIRVGAVVEPDREQQLWQLMDSLKSAP